MLELKLLLLLMVANGLPVILFRWLGDRFSQPVDGGALFFDGRPLFGHSKTWRGFLGGTVGAAIISVLLGYSMMFGMVFGLLSLSGDLVSSFIKRRMSRESSSRAIGLDQIPEAIIPLIVGAAWLGYGANTIIIVTLSFFLLDVLASPILYHMGIRKRPH